MEPLSTTHSLNLANSKRKKTNSAVIQPASNQEIELAVNSPVKQADVMNNALITTPRPTPAPEDFNETRKDPVQAQPASRTGSHDTPNLREHEVEAKTDLTRFGKLTTTTVDPISALLSRVEILDVRNYIPRDYRFSQKYVNFDRPIFVKVQFNIDQKSTRI